MLFYTYPRIDLCMKRKKSQFKSIYFSGVKNCVFHEQIDLESFVLSFFAISDYLNEGVSFTAENGNAYFKGVSIILVVNFAKIRASVTLFACHSFYITIS